jgi:phenylacetate-CoA ligase
MSADAYFDASETRSPDRREAEQMRALAAQIAHARSKTEYYRALLRDIDPASVSNRAALAALPVTRKSALIEQQKRNPPFGGLNATDPGRLLRLFVSPGPIADPEGAGRDWWRMGRALFAAGFRAGEIVHNSFSYHLTPAGFMFDSAAQALGCAVFPGGVGNSEQQAEALHRFAAHGYVGTPDFLKTLLEKADELGLSLPRLSKGCVSGGALFPALRQAYADRGIAVLQCYGTADLGLIAYESPAREGMILDEDVIVEIVRPGTGDPVPDGDVGEVVVTSFNPDYPLIRFATGDLSAILPGVSPCGRTAPRIKGWMGRADQTTKIKGMFVRPEQVADFVARHAEVTRARVIADRQGEMDVMTVQVETRASNPALYEGTVLDVLKLRGTVELVPPGSLPNDGKVIEDRRSYG